MILPVPTVHYDWCACQFTFKLKFILNHARYLFIDTTALYNCVNYVYYIWNLLFVIALHQRNVTLMQVLLHSIVREWYDWGTCNCNYNYFSLGAETITTENIFFRCFMPTLETSCISLLILPKSSKHLHIFCEVLRWYILYNIISYVYILLICK